MARIFISYSNKDDDIRSDLAQKLTSLGHQVIFDREIIEPASNFDEGLSNAMREADGSIFLLTQNSVHSRYVMKEWGAADQMRISEGKFLIPIVAEKAELPSFVQQIQYFKLEDPQLIDKIQLIILRVIPYEDRLTKVPSEVPPAETMEQQTTSQPKKRVKVNIRTQQQTPEGPSYWFLKLNPNTWKLTDLEKYQKNSDEALFGTHNLENERRVDYDSFFKVKQGDKAIGYAFGDKRAVVCIFEVINGVDIRKEVGEVIALRIEKVISPPIPIEFYSDQLSFRDKLEADDPERIFPISAAVFSAIAASDQVGYTTHEGYLTNYTTEGDHHSTDDQLSFAADISSFGTVICLKRVMPPLAIGLFGKWGSGKSFFMEKLADHIDQLALTKDPRFVQHVVQVRFNSWHYSDSNLWASLITEIFDSLNSYAANLGKGSEIEKLSATLQLTSLHKEEAEQKKKELSEKVNGLREKQKEKRARLEDLSGLKFLKTLFSDPKVKADIDSLNNGGLEAIKGNQEKVEGYIRDLDTAKGKIKLFFRQLLALRGIRWLWLILSAFAIFLLAYLIHNRFSFQWQQITLWFSLKTGLFAVAGGKIAEAAKSHGKLFKQINERWASLKKTFNERPQEPNTALDAHEKELFEVTASLKVIDQKIDLAKKEIADISSGKKLLEFIDRKSRDEGYAKQLGLIASIRKDFQTLDHLLREQHAVGDKKTVDVGNPENVQLEIDRIVLYIDDLDRCNEDIVVRVLEAIHLLLAFPLFVVVVGVDPRWLNNALNKKYSELFNAGGTTARQQSITSYDYLEKIFQIPFTLKDADRSDRERLLKYLMREELAKAETPSAPIPEPPSPAPKKEILPPKPSPVVTVEESAQVLNKVDFREEEIGYMENISGMFGQTPRMMNRYVNIYRIIKSHKNYQVSRVPSARDYKSTMFVLAIIIGCPAYARTFVELLNTSQQERMVDFADQLPHKELRKFIAEHTDKNAVNDLSTIMVKKNLPLISRFSFRTYEIDSPIDPMTAQGNG